MVERGIDCCLQRGFDCKLMGGRGSRCDLQSGNVANDVFIKRFDRATKPPHMRRHAQPDPSWFNCQCRDAVFSSIQEGPEGQCGHAPWRVCDFVSLYLSNSTSHSLNSCSIEYR